MNRLFFILGRETQLSLAELSQVISGNSKYIDGTENTILLDLDSDIDVTSLQNRLGGTIKIGRIFAELSSNATTNEIINEIENDISNNDFRNFGISFEDNRLSTRTRTKIGLTIKTNLKRQGQSLRYVDSKDAQLSSVVVGDQLLKKGREYYIIRSAAKIWLGITMAVQNWRDWSDRDFGRPARDARRGMLPPKLARMMINISGANSERDVLLDPFCGVGTILSEACLLGFKKVIGTDRDQPAIDQARENIDWLGKRYEQVDVSGVTLEKSSVEDLSVTLPGITPTFIVSEGDLGSPDLAHRPDDFRLASFHRLEETYREWLATLAQTVDIGAKLVFAIPRLTHPQYDLDLLNSISSNGWQKLQIFSEEWMNHPALSQKRVFLNYQRPDQIVARTLLILEKIK